MAVVTKNQSSLRLRFNCGLDEQTQKTIIRSKTYGSVKPNALSDDMFDVAKIIESLQEHTLMEVARIDNSTLSE